MWDKGCCIMEECICENAIPCDECPFWLNCATCRLKEDCYSGKEINKFSVFVKE